MYGVYFHLRTSAPKAHFNFWGSQTGPAIFSQDAIRQTEYGIPATFWLFCAKRIHCGEGQDHFLEVDDLVIIQNLPIIVT